MSKYVLSFRNNPTSATTGDVDAEWGQWFGQLGTTVVDFGHRVGQTRSLGGTPGDTLGGYVVIEAVDLDAAVAVANGCPGLGYGGGVEAGEVVAM